MGITTFDLFDEDGVSEHNLPNQFFKTSDIGKFKVDALADLILDFSRVGIISTNPKMFERKSKLNPLTIVATDSMESRKLVWEEFLKQNKTKSYIEARMGAELGLVYTIQDKSKKNINFYEETLYSDDYVKPLPCTGKSIIYNVLMISSLMCRSVKAVVHEEKKYPREITFNMTFINPSSFMVR